MFFFDNSYRPVPLLQKFIGVKGQNPTQAKILMTELCYEKILESLKDGNQVMVFVHSRKDTVKTAETLRILAQNRNTLGLKS